MNLHISAFNLLVIIVYILVTIFIGWFLSKRLSGYEGFSVGGRAFGPFMLASAIGATNFSTSSLVGNPGMVYNSGIAVVWLAWNAMACVASAVLFVPIYRKLSYHTMSEIFEDRYNGVNRGLISVIWMISDTLNRYGVTVYAAAVIMGLLLGIKMQYMILIMAVLILLLTYLGGLVSVIITDALQFALMWVGLFIGSIYIFGHFGGWTGLTDAVPHRLLEMVPSSKNSSGWPWIIAMTALGFPYFVTSQFVMQKGLSAKSVNVARWGVLLAGFLALPMAFMAAIPGLAAKIMIPAHVAKTMNPDMIGPEVYMNLLPAGAIGIFFASLLAAGISTADGALVGVSSLFTQDFYKKWKPDRDEKHYLRVTRITTIAFCVIGTAWAFVVPKLGGAINAILNVVSITDMPIFVVICLAVFWRKMNATGALTAIICGTIGGAIVSLLGFGGIQGLAVTTATSTTVALVVGIMLSLMSSRKEKEEKRVEKFFENLSTPKNG